MSHLTLKLSHIIDSVKCIAYCGNFKCIRHKPSGWQTGLMECSGYGKINRDQQSQNKETSTLESGSDHLTK